MPLYLSITNALSQHDGLDEVEEMRNSRVDAGVSGLGAPNNHLMTLPIVI